MKETNDKYLEKLQNLSNDGKGGFADLERFLKDKGINQVNSLPYDRLTIRNRLSNWRGESDEVLYKGIDSYIRHKKNSIK